MYWENLCVRERRERLQSIGRLQSTVNLTLIKSITNARGKGPREKWKEWEGQVVTFQGMKFWPFYNNKHYKLTRKNIKCYGGNSGPHWLTHPTTSGSKALLYTTFWEVWAHFLKAKTIILKAIKITF